MISETNSTDVLFLDSEEQYSDLVDPKTTDAVLENLNKRRQNALSGGVNCIPLPFERFRTEVPGIEQGQYIVVTANQKVFLWLI